MECGERKTRQAGRLLFTNYDDGLLVLSHEQKGGCRWKDRSGERKEIEWPWRSEVYGVRKRSPEVQITAPLKAKGRGARRRG